ncbi:ParB/RepB/Spo0J family partition protein [Brevundimonas vesicularis]|uniref:ParB/RepB/Spo0J family partition protein n=1 Tax=Brevundimonas vesicularis TaxID=41276 RepID=UPI001572241C|nr:ParB/RepB/Spo0J family partition protein [Brevundimonas vesicularis]NSX34461.1 ParB/RepB/Spo0J family partition protein [Brevundimonas vesicularis]
MTDAFALSLSDLTSDGGIEVLALPLSEVREDPDQPRDDLDTPKAKEALAELAETVKDRGVLQPITVRPRDASGVYVIRFGHRRYRASLLAGLPTIPAIVKEGDGTEEDHLYDQVIENEQREGLSTLQMANFVKKLIARGQKPAEIARRLGKQKAHVSHLIAIADLPDDLAAVAGGLGPRTLAELLAAYKIDAKATMGFVDENGADAITQVQARSFAQMLKGNTETAKDAPSAPVPASPSTAEAQEAPSLAAEAPSTPSAPPSAPAPVEAPPVAPVAAPTASPAPSAPKPVVAAPAPSPAPSGEVVPFAKANDATVALIDKRTHDALTRLFKIARSDTGQAGRVARFLMACWNANDLGGFDVADLFAVDRAIARDMANVVEFFAEQDTAIYFDAMGFKDEIVAVVGLWGAN